MMAGRRPIPAEDLLTKARFDIGRRAARRLADAVTLVTALLLFDWARNFLVGNHTRQGETTEGLLGIWAVNLVVAVVLTAVLLAVYLPLFRGARWGRREGPLHVAVVATVLCVVESLHYFVNPAWGLAAGVVVGGIALAVRSRVRERVRWIALTSSQALVVLVVLAGGLSPGGGPPLPPVPPPDRPLPNIFLIVVDTVRSDHLSAYGYSRPTTPFVQRLAAKSTLFTRAYSGTPTTTPSTAAILGAPFPYTTSYPDNRLKPEGLSLAADLRERGYRTGAISANPFVSIEMGFDRGFDRFDQLRYPEKDYAVTHVLWVAGERLGVPVPDPLRAERVREKARRWLAGLDRDRPVFAYLHFMDPHYPYTPGRRFRDAFIELGKRGRQRFPGKVSFGFLPGDPGTPFPEPVRKAMESFYDAEIAQWDHSLGLIWDELEREGWLRDAVVVVTADHGECFYEHGVWLHGNSLFNEVLRVPLLVYRSWAPEPRRVDALASNTGIADFLREIVDGYPGSREGLEPGPAFTRNRSGVVCQYSSVQGLYRGAAVIRDSTKSLLLMKGDAETRYLFDLGSDPGETRNLYPDFPDRWEVSLRSLVPSSGASPEPVSPGTEDLLKSLGYTQ